MSLAANEMKEPPAGIRRAKATLLVQLVPAIAYVVASVQEAKIAAALFWLGMFVLHLVACGFIGHAATQMGRKWWRYLTWQLLVPFFGPLAALTYLEHWRDSRT